MEFFQEKQLFFLQTLPNLKYLDGYDINDEEAESDSEILQEGGDDEDDDDGVGDGLDDTDNDDEGNDDEEDSDVGLDYLQSSTVMQVSLFNLSFFFTSYQENFYL